MSSQILAALLGGVLTLLAPCSVMILPAFFAYAFTSPRALLSRTAVYWAGLLTTLMPLALLASGLGALLRDHMGTATLIGGAVIIILGLMQAMSVPLHLPLPGGSSREAGSPIAVYLLGALAGAAGVGCAGPILGTVLVMAGLGGSPMRAGLLVIAYSLGMVLPLALLSLTWERLGLSSRSWLRPRTLRILGRTTTWTELIGGLLCAGLGAVMVVLGPSGLGGGLLTTSRMAAVEQRLLTAAAAVPSWLVAALVVAVVALVAVAAPGAHSRRRRRH